MQNPPEMLRYDLAVVTRAATDVAGVVDFAGDDNLTLPCVWGIGLGCECFVNVMQN